MLKVSELKVQFKLEKEPQNKSKEIQQMTIINKHII